MYHSCSSCCGKVMDGRRWERGEDEEAGVHKKIENPKEVDFHFLNNRTTEETC